MGKVADGVEDGKVVQSVVISVNSARYPTRKLSIAFAREVWRPCIADYLDCFVLPTLEEQKNVTKLRLDVENVVCEGVRGAANNDVKPMPLLQEDDD